MGNHNSHLQEPGIPKVSADPTAARFEFGDGRVRDVRRAAEIKVGNAGHIRALIAFALEADIPALLRNGAPEALDGPLDFIRHVLTIRNHEVDTPLKVNGAGHHVPTVVAFGEGPSRVDRGPLLAASYSEWAVAE